MLKKSISVLITAFLVSANSVASDFSGYVTAKIDSFSCIMNQDNKPEIILRTDVVNILG